MREVGWEGGRVEGGGGQGIEGKEEKEGKGGRRGARADGSVLASPQDGGCACPGDVAKAFGKRKGTVSPSLLPSSHPPLLHPPPSPPSSLSGAGADYVMLGGMLAGHDQSGGDIIERDGKMYKLFYGMSSATAMKKYSGGVKDYR